MQVIEVQSIYFCLIICDRRIQLPTDMEVLSATNESTILSLPIPSWGGRNGHFRRKLIISN
jgi:hypothetical protein